MVRAQDRFGEGGAATCNRLTGVQAPTGPDTCFFIDNWVSPLLPTHVVSRPSGRGTGQRVGEDGRSACRLVTGRRGPHTRGYPTRKGADCRWVLTREHSSHVRLFGDVRQ